jgi:hypothetical protein
VSRFFNRVLLTAKKSPKACHRLIHFFGFGFSIENGGLMIVTCPPLWFTNSPITAMGVW